MNSLEVQSITKEICQEKVLNKVNFCASGGKIYGIVGKNGSGKSMLFRAISGLVKVDNGSIVWNGEDCTRNLAQKIRMGIIVENVNLYADLNAMENLRYLAKINNYIGEKEIIETLDKIGLDSNNKKKMKTFSLGMRQKLVIALDEETVRRFREILKEEKRRGAIILIASHNREDIEELCDEVYVMNDGVLSR